MSSISRYERYQVYLVVLIGDAEYSKLSTEVLNFRNAVMERLQGKPTLRRWYDQMYRGLMASKDKEWWTKYGFLEKKQFDEGLMSFVGKLMREDVFGKFALARESNFSICNGTENLNMDKVVKTADECIYEKDCEKGDDSFDCVERSFKCMWDSVNGIGVTGRSANAKGDPFMSKMPDVDNLSGSKWSERREGPPGPVGTRSTSKLPAKCTYSDIGSSSSREVKQSMYIDTIKGGLFQSMFSSVGDIFDFGRLKNNMINGVKNTSEGTCERVAIKTIHITNDEFEPVITQCCTPKYMTRGDIEALQISDMERTKKGHGTIFCDEVAVMGPILTDEPKPEPKPEPKVLPEDGDVEDGDVEDGVDESGGSKTGVKKIKPPKNACYCQTLTLNPSMIGNVKSGFRNMDLGVSDGDVLFEKGFKGKAPSLQRVFEYSYLVAIGFLLFLLFLRIRG